MEFSVSDIASLLLALTLLLGAAHGFGYLFRWMRQPPVIGEIMGGLLLGPTIFGYFFPELQHAVFAGNAKTQTILGAIYQLGLLLLMFCSGGEIRATFQSGERRTASLITLTGTAIPFALGVLFLRMIDADAFVGAAGNETAFLLVFAIGVAVTSIPVISRILHDLGILETDFARIILSAAVIEDVVLYVVLAVALSMVGTGPDQAFGVPAALGLHDSAGANIAYHSAITLVFFWLALLVGPAVFRWANRFRYNLVRKSSPVAHLLTFCLIMTGLAVFLGVAPMFGAFVAGIVTGQSVDDAEMPRNAITTFSFAFFIPIYFAIVGLRLDLVRAFDPGFFLLFFAFACFVKALSVYLGARAAGESHTGATNLSVAMNARGGPGIVLASLAFDAAIINESFYSILVMLAIVTSLLAGSWLDRTVRSGMALR